MCLFILHLLPGNFHLFWSSNNLQIKKINELTTLLDQMGQPLIFDGIGILPRANMIYSYLGPDDLAATFFAESQVLNRKPVVLLQTSRFAYLPEPLKKKLEGYYTDVGGGLLIVNERANGVTFDRSVHLTRLFCFDPFL